MKQAEAPVTDSSPTHRPMREIYKRASKPPQKPLTLNIAVEVFFETLEIL
jgi:hypothetical protein